MPQFVHSEAGHNHRNEDFVAVQAHPANSGVTICALADGQGGQFGGARAAQVAVEKCLELASNYSIEQLSDSSMWLAITSAADEAVSDDADAGYTTLICLCVTKNQIYGASCGDSALLLINNSKAIWLSENQRKNPPVGSGAAVPVVFSAELSAGFQVVAMSDGVWKSMESAVLIQTCVSNRGQQLIDALRELALKNNAGKLHDDFSAIVVE